MSHTDQAAYVVEIARKQGFDFCGIAPAADFPELAHVKVWLEQGCAGEMRYLHDERRRSPSLVMDGARTIIVCALNYNTALPYSTEVPPQAGAPEGPHGWISRYAWGDDYHDVLGGKLKTVIEAMRQEFREPFAARAYVDTGPIVERVAAKYAGLGWLAKNSCLINEHAGSWLFLGAIVCTLDLAPTLKPLESPPPDLCGNCTMCIDACPTGAIVEPYSVDARRCISYLTIELRGTIPRELRALMGRHVFGCDICQDVCPWNRGVPVTASEHFQPRRPPIKDGTTHSDTESSDRMSPVPRIPGVPSPALQPSVAQARDTSLFFPELAWLLSLSEDDFRQAFRRSPVKRAKWRGLLRNTCVALGNSRMLPGQPHYETVCARLAGLAAGDDSVIAEHAGWALDQLLAGAQSRLASDRVAPTSGRREQK